METFIVMYRNDYDEDIIQSVHSSEQEALESLPSHLAAWGWERDARGLKFFSIQIWAGGYINDVAQSKINGVNLCSA